MSNRELIVIFGLPGSGKSTQSHLMHDRLGHEIMSLGGYFRKLSTTDPEIKKAMDAGIIFPDEMTIKAIKGSLEELSSREGVKGIIHDDIVSAAQAQAEDDIAKELGLKGPYPVLVKITKEEARDRLSVRLVCSTCIIPIRPGSQEDKDACHKCGGEIIKRTDDNPEAIAHRLGDYSKRIEEIAQYYESLGRLITINGSQEVEDIYTDIIQALNKVRSS